MAVKKIVLQNFTVFEKLDLEFSEGINIFIGENGSGKTHLMKLIYSACQAVDPKISFSNKIVRTFKPDDFRISRLIHRKRGTSNAMVRILAEKNGTTKKIQTDFHTKTKKWDADVKYEESWETQLSNLTSTFIPAKEILSNSFNIISAAEKNNIDFDDTYLDIIHSAKVDISAGRDSASKKSQLDILERIIEGKVYFDFEKDKFYLKQGSSKVEFNLVAEGIRKIALLWQLMKNGTLEKGAVLFWDEPEANINPVHMPLIVEMLLALQENGVQVFISTHDYILAKYFEVKSEAQNSLIFHSLYKTPDTGICVESNQTFGDLEFNPISEAFVKLLDEVYGMDGDE